LACLMMAIVSSSEELSVGGSSNTSSSLSSIAPVYRWAAQDGAVRAYMGFSYIKYSRTSFIPFYYTTEVLNLRPY
jgi:hypothetical protein